MAKQQHAAQQQELQLFWELRRERSNTNIKRVQQADVFGFLFQQNQMFDFWFSFLAGGSD